MATSKRPIKYVVITIDYEAPINQRPKKISFSCNKVDGCSGGKDGRRYVWFSIPIDEINEMLGRLK